MVKKIEKLTPEQEAQIPGWAEKWIQRGLNCEPADYATFAHNAELCYGFAGIPWPGLVVPVGNPMVGSFAAPIADVLHCAQTALTDARRAEIREVAGEDLADAVLAAVEAAMAGSSYKPTKKRLSFQSAVKESWHQFFGGAWWASWPAHTSFFREVCHLELDVWDRDIAYAEAQMAVGWWWPAERFVMATDRPKVIHLDRSNPQRSRLHCETGPAIAYRDGWSLYFLEGIAVQPHVVENPAAITLDEIRSERNAELRRILTQQFGLLRYFREVGAKPLDSRTGEVLFRDEQTGDRWLVCTDGSTGRIYQLRVPNTVNTVSQAQTALNGVDPGLMLARS